MKNNKGITLIELLISISLVSIVIIFLFRLLVDVRITSANNNFDKDNQQKRALIVRTVENDFIENQLVGLTDSGSTRTYLKLTFTFKNNTRGILEANNRSVTYTDSSNNKETWTIEGEGYNYSISCLNYKFYKSNNNYYIKFSIPVFKSEEKDTYLDDLEFSYVGNGKINDSNFKNSLKLGYC